MVVTGGWPDIINPAMRKIYDDVFAIFPTEFDKLFDIDTSDRNYEKFSTATGFGMAQDVGEAQEIPADDPEQGYDVTFTHKKIGKAFLVSKETLEDDLFKVIAAKPKALARGIRRKVEYDCADIFNNASTTTNNTGGDGKALSDGSHPREDGGAAQSNEGTAALSENALSDIIIAGAGILDGKGQKINITYDLLVTPVNLENTARIIMETANRVGGDLNDINPLKGKFDIFTYNWLTDTNNYFLIDRNIDSGLKFFWRRKPTLERDDQVSNDVARWYSTARYSYGWIDWRFFYGGIVA